MNEIEFLAKTLCRELGAGSPLVLISILNMEGSTPRHDGTKMLVGTGGKTWGTIGGSLMEAAAIKEAGKVLSSGVSRLITFELDGKDAAAPGMICGGKAEIFLDYLPPNEEALHFASVLNKAVSQGKDFFILTKYKTEGQVVKVFGHAIIDTNNNLLISSAISTEDIEKIKPELHNVSVISPIPVADSVIIVDRVRKVKTMFCFGAGHVAVPTAHIAALAGFRVIVLDDREEFANKERFPESNKTIVLKNYEKAFDGLEIDKDSFIVIVTRGHKYDRTVLEQSLKTGAGYIGMISSRRKRQAIYDALMADGVSKEQLDFVHSPIGIDIGGETPEEIAVSIVAELIKVRSGQE